jgi:hypothetical protein
MYSILGVHSTQCNELYHVVVKVKLHKHLSLSKAVQIIVDQTKEIGHIHNNEINWNWRALPWLLDQEAFAYIEHMLMHYALDIVMCEWSASEVIADHIEKGKKSSTSSPKNCIQRGVRTLHSMACNASIGSMQHSLMMSQFYPSTLAARWSSLVKHDTYLAFLASLH